MCEFRKIMNANTHCANVCTYNSAEERQHPLPLKLIQYEIISLLESLKISYPEAIYMVNWISVIKCIS